MPQILPLRGLRYSTAAGSLSDLLAPPYDVISSRQEQELRERSPHNAIHLELAEDTDDRYERIAKRLQEWTGDGTLVRDETPQLYVYEQRFHYDGQQYARRALLAGVEAQPWEEAAVRPHEYTMSGPKEDRLNLLKATKTQFSPCFMIARDRAGQLQQFLDETAANEPDATGTTIDGEEHRLWAVEADTFMFRRLAPLLSETFYIADGHHRYETAVNYRNWLLEQEGTLPKDHPARFTMTAIVPATDGGLVVRPIYRWVPEAAPSDWREKLEPVFEIGELDSMDEEKLLATLGTAPNIFVAIGLEPGKVHTLTPRDGVDLAKLPGNQNSAEWAAVAPNLLRLAVLQPLWDMSDADLQAGRVEYLHDVPEVKEQVEQSGGKGVAFLLNPVRVDDVIALAEKGERMPQKSTFFHPKLGTGLVFNPLYP
ncbi:MAG: DUF1015 domain-containing protein [Dehalococcoidia bacterium]|nr:DUF1015 domain-containing protein [Dehalococcoidia bacterium]